MNTKYKCGNKDCGKEEIKATKKDGYSCKVCGCGLLPICETHEPVTNKKNIMKVTLGLNCKEFKKQLDKIEEQLDRIQGKVDKAIGNGIKESGTVYLPDAELCSLPENEHKDIIFGQIKLLENLQEQHLTDTMGLPAEKRIEKIVTIEEQIRLLHDSLTI